MANKRLNMINLKLNRNMPQNNWNINENLKIRRVEMIDTWKKFKTDEYLPFHPVWMEVDPCKGMYCSGKHHLGHTAYEQECIRTQF